MAAVAGDWTLGLPGLGDWTSLANWWLTVDTGLDLGVGELGNETRALHLHVEVIKCGPIQIAILSQVHRSLVYRSLF